VLIYYSSQRVMAAQSGTELLYWLWGRV